MVRTFDVRVGDERVEHLGVHRLGREDEHVPFRVSFLYVDVGSML